MDQFVEMLTAATIQLQNHLHENKFSIISSFIPAQISSGFEYHGLEKEKEKLRAKLVIRTDINFFLFIYDYVNMNYDSLT